MYNVTKYDRYKGGCVTKQFEAVTIELCADCVEVPERS
jgi:hypothetical protein